MNSFQIETADTKDIDGMILLLKQLFSIEKDFVFNPQLHKKGLELMLDGCSKHKVVKVARMNEKPIGMCTAQMRISTAKGEFTAVVEDLVVDESCRGKGIGKALLNAVYGWAGNRGIRHLQLLADKNNRPGLQFYNRMEWNPTDLICLTTSIAVR